MIDLSLDELTWKEITVKGKKPRNRYGHIGIKYKNKMIVHGGKAEKEKVEDEIVVERNFCLLLDD